MERLQADAAMLGLSTGMRTFAGVAVLALTGRLGGERARQVLPALAVGEMVVDKLSFAHDRIEPPGLVGRGATSLIAGNAVGGRTGAGISFAAAAIGVFACHRARVELGARLPDPLVAVTEDLIAIGLAGAAARQ